MIRPTISLINKQQVEQAMKDLAKSLSGKTRVLVGVPSGAGTYEDGMTIATVAAVNEFGAKDVQHAGGVAYGYKTKKDAEDGKVRFLEAGKGFMELGKTGPYTGDIPARPFLRPGVEGAIPHLTALAEIMIPKVLSKDMTMRMLLEQMGNLAEGAVKQAITDKKDPPNAKATIRKKGANNPLIDTGNMRQSIRYVIDDTGEPLEEGI